MASVIPMQCSTSWWAGSWSLCKFVIYSYAIPYHPQCTYSDFHVFTIKNTSYCHVQADDWVNFPSNVDVTPHTEEIQEPHKQRTYVTWCYYSLIPSAFTKLLIFFSRLVRSRGAVIWLWWQWNQAYFFGWTWTCVQHSSPTKPYFRDASSEETVLIAFYM